MDANTTTAGLFDYALPLDLFQLVKAKIMTSAVFTDQWEADRKVNAMLHAHLAS